MRLRVISSFHSTQMPNAIKHTTQHTLSHYHTRNVSRPTKPQVPISQFHLNFTGSRKKLDRLTIIAIAQCDALSLVRTCSWVCVWWWLCWWWCIVSTQESMQTHTLKLPHVCMICWVAMRWIGCPAIRQNRRLDHDVRRLRIVVACDLSLRHDIHIIALFFWRFNSVCVCVYSSVRFFCLFCSCVYSNSGILSCSIYHTENIKFNI